jgi:hypothetical protein
MGNVQDTKSSPCSHSPLAPTLPIPNSSSQDGQQNGTTQTGHPVGPASRPFTHISRPQKSECEADISSEKCGFDVARAGDGTCLPCTMHWVPSPELQERKRTTWITCKKHLKELPGRHSADWPHILTQLKTQDREKSWTQESWPHYDRRTSLMLSPPQSSDNTQVCPLTTLRMTRQSSCCHLPGSNRWHSCPRLSEEAQTGRACPRPLTSRPAELFALPGMDQVLTDKPGLLDLQMTEEFLPLSEHVNIYACPKCVRRISEA